jgi:CHAT domain-containing protein
MGLYSSRVNPAIVSRQEQQAFIPIYYWAAFILVGDPS